MTNSVRKATWCSDSHRVDVFVCLYTATVILSSESTQNWPFTLRIHWVSPGLSELPVP